MIPDVKYSLPILFVLWCGLGVWATGGPVMLAYPLMWLGVAAVFYAVTKAMGGPAANRS